MAGARVDRSSAGQSYCPRERSAHDLSEDGLMHMYVDVEAGQKSKDLYNYVT